MSDVTTAREGSTNVHRNRGGSLCPRAGRGLHTRLFYPRKHIVHPRRILPNTDEGFAIVQPLKIRHFLEKGEGRSAEKGPRTSGFPLRGNRVKRFFFFPPLLFFSSSHPLHVTYVPLIRASACWKRAQRIPLSGIFSVG